MKKLLIVLSLITMFVGNALAVDSPNQDLPPVYKAQALGYVFMRFCEDGLEGDWVNSNPNFYQAWACEDGNWCLVRPETFGCPQVNPL